MNSSQTPQETVEREGQSRPLWRNRNFLLLQGGQVISTLGTNISRLALPLLALAITHSAAQAGLLIATRQIPYLLFSLPAGALVDRWDRKATMIYCDLARWLALGSVPLAFALGHLTLVHLYIAGFVEGTAYVLFSIAQLSALPQVVTPERLPQAYALDTTTEYAGSLFGPTLGALIIGLVPVISVGAVLAYLTDSVSYVVSVISLAFMRVSFQGQRERVEKPSLYKEIIEGLRFLWKDRRLRAMVLLTTALNVLFGPLDLAAIILARGPLHSDLRTLGFVVSAGGVGGVLGSLLAPWIRQRVRFGLIMFGALGIWIVAGLLLTFAFTPLVLIGGMFLSSFAWPPYGVAVVSYRLSLTPDELRGRVNSSFRFLSYGCEPLGVALGGLLLAASGPRPLFGVITAGVVLCLLATSATELRRV